MKSKIKKFWSHKNPKNVSDYTSKAKIMNRFLPNRRIFIKHHRFIEFEATNFELYHDLCCTLYFVFLDGASKDVPDTPRDRGNPTFTGYLSPFVHAEVSSISTSVIIDIRLS
jgi:hypothetical protein